MCGFGIVFLSPACHILPVVADFSLPPLSQSACSSTVSGHFQESARFEERALPRIARGDLHAAASGEARCFQNLPDRDEWHRADRRCRAVLDVQLRGERGTDARLLGRALTNVEAVAHVEVDAYRGM